VGTKQKKSGVLAKWPGCDRSRPNIAEGQPSLGSKNTMEGKRFILGKKPEKQWGGPLAARREDVAGQDRTLRLKGRTRTVTDVQEETLKVTNLQQGPGKKILSDPET